MKIWISATAILLCLFLYEVRSAIADSCVPSAEIEGDAVVVEPISRILKNHGINNQSEDDCPTVSVRIDKRQDGLLRLRIEDPDGRHSSREVAGNEAAVALIESWTRRDLNTFLPELDNNREKDAQTKEKKTPVVEKAEDKTGMEDSTSQIWLDLGAEVSSGFDGSIWMGGRLAGCYILGPICIGALASISFDTKANGDSELLETNRFNMNVLGTVALPITLRSFRLFPGVGLGIHQTSFDKLDSDNGDEDLIEFSQSGLIINTHINGTIRIDNDFFFLIGVAVDLLPTAHTSAFEEDNTRIAGEPRGYFRLNAALGYGFL